MNFIVKFTDSNIKNIILNVCILLFGINFLYKCNYILMATFILLLVFKKFKINFGNKITLITLILFSISWYVFSDGHDIAGICLPLCYLIGCNISEEDENGITKLILLVSISLALYTTLFFINNALKNGITNYDVYNQPNIWTGRPLWATNIMLYSSLFYGCFGFVVFDKNTKFKILYFIIFVINAFYAFMLGRRAALLMIGLSLVVSFICKLIFDKENKKRYLKIMYLLLIIGIVSLLLMAVLYKFNILDFKEIIKRTDLYIRFIGSGRPWLLFYDMGRSEIRKRFISHMIEYPWGGSHIRELVGNYAHDLWLDAYDVAGLVSAIIMVLYSVLFVINIIKIMKNKNINSAFKTLIISLSICILAQCCIEPIMEACKAYIFAVCLIDGAISIIGDKCNE